ncbi:MAG: sel1 repeat family protein [Deltaproteobacteria bacterium]|nr:sel1 repeat family protein [Deltaproteobacteria bacterium]
MRVFVWALGALVAACGGGSSAAPAPVANGTRCGGHALSCEEVVTRFLNDGDEAHLVALDLDNECAAGRTDSCDALGVFLLEGEEVQHDPPRALRLLAATCERGDVSACRRLVTHVAGAPAGDTDGVGLEAGRSGCAAGDADSCTAAGALTYRGRGVERDRGAALVFYQRGCELGSDRGCRRVADHYVGSNDRASLVGLYRQMCDDDRARGCTLLGDLHARGGSAAERLEIGPLYERGCAGGDVDGCTHLGRALARGAHGVPPDAGRARELLEQSCRVDDHHACAELGRVEQLGIGGPADAERAQSLYRRACDHRNGIACYHLGLAARERRRGRDDEAVLDYFRRACDSGDIPRACGTLAFMYDTGEGAEQSVERAEPLYHTACDGGHADSCMRLADLVDGDPTRAQSYRTAACEARIVADRCETRAVPPRSYAGRVTAVRGRRTLREGAHCSVVYDAQADGGHCRLTVRCADVELYGGADEEWATCRVTRTSVVATDFETSPFDGSPQLTLDTEVGTLTVGDVSAHPASSWVEIAVSAAP